MNLSVALISDIDRRKSIPIIRSLGKKGVKIYGLSYKKYPIGITSKYCSNYFLCPDYKKKPIEFLSYLKEICQKIRPDVFYPIEDVVLSLCVNNPKYWKPYTNALLPTSDVLEICYDKWKTIQFASKSGIRTPITYCPNSVEEVQAIADKWTGGAVIKPRKSSGSRGIVYVENGSFIEEAYRQVSQNYPMPLIQEKLPSSGKGLGVFVLMDNRSETVAVFGHKRIREFPISGGPSTLRVSYRDNSLIAQTVRFLQKIRFSGVAMAEYKIDERNSKPTLLELNPRFWGSLQLPVSAGIDFPFLYHLLSMGIDVKPIKKFKEGVYCRWLIPGDILHFLANPNRFKLKPSFFKFYGENQHYDILSMDDPLPIFGILVESLRRITGR